jgi:hypothetical protein
MARDRPVPGRKHRSPLRKAIMAIRCVGFCGMQWRAIGQLSSISFRTP